ncbi:MAG: Phytanoyl-CoA dioxygenase (PhyH) [candidate division BRC1 bacterium ADurb.BinA292]|nr:MAG: Phytanoyl-CoA dioxygenase (PhyH) [candidate division BRC1 bacterium ADurb.BinA292]
MTSQTQTTEPMRLTEEQLEAYRRDGYIMIENLVTPEELKQLHHRQREYTHCGRDASKLSIQVEPRIQRGEVKVDHPGDGIRKIDGLIEHDDLFRRLGTHPNILEILEQILGPDIKLYRNTLLLKPPLVGSAKGMHQDSPYWPIEPMELCSCWFTLDAATPENGCMGVIPGAHRRGPLPHHQVPDDFVMDESSYDMRDVKLVPMPAGAGLFFHSLLPHVTAPNTSRHWRRAITMTYMSARSRYTGEGESPNFMTVRGRGYPGCVG